MNPLDELKYIVTSQRTVTTKRLWPLVEAATKSFIEKGNKIISQRESLKRKDEEIEKLKKINAELAYKYGFTLMLEDEKKKLRKGVKR